MSIITSNGELPLPTPTHPEEDSEGLNVNAAVSQPKSFKLPPFWAHDPEMWFATVEYRFRIHQVKADSRKFDYIVDALPHEIVADIRDLILRPPITNAYETIKNTIIQRSTLSQQQRLHQLLNDQQLGDKKPSQLLRRMQQLAGDMSNSTGDTLIIKELFMSRLPRQVRAVLATADPGTTLDKLAEMADKIVEVIDTSTIQLNAVVDRPTLDIPAASSGDFSRLVEQVEKLSARVESLFAKQHRQFWQQPATRTRSHSRHNKPKAQASGEPAQILCWYHHRFGERANKCRAPCQAGNGSGHHF